jgi:hypothetical protein
MENAILEGYLNRFEYAQAFKEKVVLEVCPNPYFFD